MEDKDITEQITIDERIEGIVRTIHQNVILFYQEYVDFNGRASFYSDLKKYESNLNKSIDTFLKIKNICIREFDKFIKENGDVENNNIIKDLRTMINDLEQYSKKLEFIMGKIINNNSINSEAYKVEINSQFKLIFEKYDEFVKTDEDVIMRLVKQENKIRLKGINNKI